MKSTVRQDKHTCDALAEYIRVYGVVVQEIEDCVVENDEAAMKAMIDSIEKKFDHLSSSDQPLHIMTDDVQLAKRRSAKLQL